MLGASALAPAARTGRGWWRTSLLLRDPRWPRTDHRRATATPEATSAQFDQPRKSRAFCGTRKTELQSDLHKGERRFVANQAPGSSASRPLRISKYSPGLPSPAASPTADNVSP